MIKVVDRQLTDEEPPINGAIYPGTGLRLLAYAHVSFLGARLRLLKSGRVSDDNGRTWAPFQPTPDFDSGLPYGYRRGPITPVADPNTGRLITVVNSMDTPGVDPDEIEPPIALSTFYLRYRVSEDRGCTWLFDEPIVQAGEFTADHPFDGIRVGTNGFFMGDAGCIPTFISGGQVLVPAQVTVLSDEGDLSNPLGQTTYTEVMIIAGSWDGPRMRWTAMPRVQVGLDVSTRGMIEPTLAEFADGRILMVMRGSNGGRPNLPAHKWYSVCSDGESWSEPLPWTYDDGSPFFSPSSMSTLFKHSSGRVFWVGNVSGENCNSNNPRWPLVMGEVGPDSLKLVRDSALEVDTRRPEDEDRGRLDLSHFHLLEDRETGEIELTYPRSHNVYKSREWAALRIAVI